MVSESRTKTSRSAPRFAHHGRMIGRLVLVVALLSGATGCAVGASVVGAPTVDTRGRFGTEERFELSAAAGTREHQLFTSFSGGGGYLGATRGSYALFSPALGFEGRRDAVRWSVSSGYVARFPNAHAVKVSHGVGVAGQVLFHVAKTGGEHGSLAIGPRLSTDAMFGLGAPDAAGDRPPIGMLQLGFVVECILSDTTATTWFLK